MSHRYKCIFFLDHPVLAKALKEKSLVKFQASFILRAAMFFARLT